MPSLIAHGTALVRRWRIMLEASKGKTVGEA
jgi:hypothetical protein